MEGYTYNQLLLHSFIIINVTGYTPRLFEGNPIRKFYVISEFQDYMEELIG